MARQAFAHSVPSAQEFLEFAKKANISLDIPVSALLESADPILRLRPGYVAFNIRCGLLIIERPELEIDVIREMPRQG